MLKIGETISYRATGEVMTVVETAVSTQGEYFAFDNFTPAGTAGPPLHFHPVQEERFVVLEGVLHAQMDGQQHQFQAGETLIVPPNAVHTYDNRHGGDVRFRIELYPPLDSDQLFAGIYNMHPKNPIKRLRQLATLLHTLDSRFYLTAVSIRAQKFIFKLLSEKK